MEMDEIIHKFVDTSLFDTELELRWNFNFNSAAVPICPRQLMLGLFSGKQDKKIPFKMRYQRHMKQAINTLVQEFWGDYLWGDWRCSDINHCGVKYKNTR